MNLGIIIQARMESERLPGKMYKKISGKHLLEWVILRAQKSKLAGKVVVALPATEKSSVLAKLAVKNKACLYEGSLDNVLDRLIKAAEKFELDPVIRITGDCPLIDPVLIDQSISRYLSLKDKPDYFFIQGYPFGLGDIEIISFSALKKIREKTKDQKHLEHIVSFISENPELFKIRVEKALPEFSRQGLRVCVDEPKDLMLVEQIIKNFEQREDFNTKEILSYLDNNPEVLNINKGVKHNFSIPKSKEC